MNNTEAAVMRDITIATSDLYQEIKAKQCSMVDLDELISIFESTLQYVNSTFTFINYGVIVNSCDRLNELCNELLIVADAIDRGAAERGIQFESLQQFKNSVIWSITMLESGAAEFNIDGELAKFISRYLNSKFK